MSKSKFVSYARRGFWAYDVALGIFLKHLIDAAEESSQAGSPWLVAALERWRIAACVPDLGLEFDADWSETERRYFIALAEDACARLSTRDSIRAEEIVSWPILDDERIFPRGAKEVHTGPVIELGRAVVALISGKLPDAPSGALWFYGTPDDRRTIPMHPSAK